MPRIAKVRVSKVLCGNCDSEFLASIDDVKRGWGKFCSNRCKAGARYKAQRAKEFIVLEEDRAIFVTHQGNKITVSIEDIHLLYKYRYRVVKNKKRGLYAYRSVKNCRVEGLHRDIMNALPDQIVDHINGNGLDNRRYNLRFATASQNTLNRRHTGKNKYRGVSTRSANSYFAYIRVYSLGKIIHLGTFHNEDLAAKIYDIHSLKYHGEFGRRSFDISPEEQSELWEYYSTMYPTKYNTALKTGE